MLSDKSQEILTKQFNALPAEIQDTILESNWKDVIHRITEKYALHIDQGGALETIVFLTMLGLEEPADFISNLKSEVRITQSLAQAITDEVERDIFQKIRRAVMEKKEAQSKEGVSIISEDAPKKDTYREDIGTPSKYVDGQHLDAQSILSEVEDPQTLADREHADIEIPKEVYSTKDVELIDDDLPADETTDLENHAALQSVVEQNPQEGGAQEMREATAATPEKPADNPLSIRTLKSDILRQKLANPSWSPVIDKTMTKNTKDIIESAERGAPQAAPTTTAPNPASDPYREAM